MIRTLLALFRPLTSIAKDIRILRELYEADCAARHIYRVTETPDKRDTEISYAGVADRRPGFKKWMDSGEDID